jgi:hypothetical protein
MKKEREEEEKFTLWKASIITFYIHNKMLFTP